MCTELKRIDIPICVEKIGYGAFADCEALEEVVLHEGLYEIDSSAFENCENLSKINIPESATDIAPDAFEGCDLL